MVSAIFGGIQAAVSGIFVIILDAFNSAANVFYDATTSQLTLVGTLLLLSTGIGMSYAALRWIKSLMPR
jgi:hypothetical protein